MKGRGCGMLGVSCALLLCAMVSIFCTASGDAEGPSFYKLQVERARLQQQRQPGKYISANGARDQFTKRDVDFKKEDDLNALKKQVYTEKADEEEQFILIEELWHRDHISSPWRVEGLSAQERTLAMLKRGEARSQEMIARRQIARLRAASHRNDSEFGSVLNLRAELFNPHIAEFFVRMYVGSQYSPNAFLVDTGADLTWLQCEPCPGCYQQRVTPRLYNPVDSSTISYVDCRTPSCTDARFSLGCNHADQCVFGLIFMDNSYTKGLIAEETFIMGGAHIRGLYFGCAHKTGGYYSPEATGILGIGGDRFSFTSQIRRNVFFCLPPFLRSPNSVPGFLGFEPADRMLPSPVNSVFTDLIDNPHSVGTYYIKMRGISINGVLLPLRDDIFDLRPDGTGGIYLDSGKVTTEFVPEVYDIFRSTFRTAAAPHLTEWRGRLRKPSDLCYRTLVPPNRTNTPSIYFHFRDSFISLPPENVFFTDAPNEYCLAFNRASHGFDENTFAGAQLAGYLVYINRADSTVFFSANQCN